MTHEIRQMILKSCSNGEIREAASRGGMRALADDGWRLVREGVTTPEEVLRVTKAQSLGTAAEEKPPAPASPASSPLQENSHALVSV